jgi:glycosyltransferase involved in cell wall biosynthesis
MFFDLDDIEHDRRVQTALEQRTWLRKIAQLARAPAVLVAERKGAALSRATFICSEHDRIRLARLGVARPTVVENAIPLPSEVAPLPKEPRILFLGFAYYKANADAAERLVREIFPRIRARVPTAELFIAGGGTQNLPSCRDAPAGVRYLGYVDDLSALYASTRLVCCPVTFGTGTRMKLIEAGAYGRPMVATRLGAEGLDFRDGHEIFLAEDDDAIAAACCRMLSDDDLARRLGIAARLMVERKYDERVVHRVILNSFDATVARTTS